MYNNTELQSVSLFSATFPASLAGSASQNTKAVGTTRQQAKGSYGSTSAKAPHPPEANQSEPPVLADPAEERETVVGQPTFWPFDHQGWQ